MAAVERDIQAASRWRIAVAVLLGSLPILAMALGGWQWWQARQGPLVVGDLRAVAVEQAAAASPVHPLLERPERVGWTAASDGGALGREGTSMIQDARTVFDADGTRRDAVHAVSLSSGVLAWASPRMVRLVDPADRAQVARVDTCGAGVDAVAQAGERLVVAACGRVVGIGPRGSARWRVEVPGAIDDARIRVHAVGAGLLVAAAGGARLRMLDGATGRERWSHELDGGLVEVRLVGTDAVAVATSSSGTSRVRLVGLADGAQRWERRWRGWRPTALASDGRRIVAGLVAVAEPERCGDVGLAELDAATGASRATRALDRRIAVRDLRVDARTGRMAALATRRACTLQHVEPRVELYGARGLVRLHQMALPAEPCSDLVAAGAMVAVATCGELLAFDARSGQQAWREALPPVSTRRTVALSATARRLVATDDVGTLAVLEPRGTR